MDAVEIEEFAFGFPYSPVVGEGDAAPETQIVFVEHVHRFPTPGLPLLECVDVFRQGLRLLAVFRRLVGNENRPGSISLRDEGFQLLVSVHCSKRKERSLRIQGLSRRCFYIPSPPELVFGVNWQGFHQMESAKDGRRRASGFGRTRTNQCT